MPAKKLLTLITLLLICIKGIYSQTETNYLLNEPIDISPDFRNFTNSYFIADSLVSFDPVTMKGTVEWQQNKYVRRFAFNNELAVLRPDKKVVFPETEYPVNPVLPFSIQFISPRAFRIRMNTGLITHDETDTLMLVKEPSTDHSWKYTTTNDGYLYTSSAGSVLIKTYPWHIEVRDSTGKLLTSTNNTSDNNTTFTPVLPFCYVERASDLSRSIAATFSLASDEKIFGCGESFTRLDKRGQKIVLWADDANGVQNPTMYKPIPFFMSSRGYGMFMHTSSPITCDFGATFNATNSLMIGDDQLDLFVFIGTPKEILNEYTDVTGKSPMPPLWSFGFWMSRISYSSEQEVRDVAAKLRQYKIPSDVIHLDVGWFETDWRTDYKFSPTRFKDPAKMISDLKNDGFHISLWQLPYFVPKNRLFPEIIDKGLYVKNAKGNLPYDDAILDFSNPATVKWYQDQLDTLLRMGVGAIKVDFGEAAPQTGIYASGKTGFYEHNLYPLRYNKAVADITKKITGENIIWARSAWAGSQRYPLHWGGDAANTSNAMLATLRGGLSFGLSGFSFWSHDIGGFVQRTGEDLYKRWAAFGFLSSHTRSHGQPPKEPWTYSKSFLETFRNIDDMRYELMPYIYAQAKDCSDKGLPMVRTLFTEFPEDPGSWLIEDEYMLGSQMLVAPLFLDSVYDRDVYLPPGKWIDYQSGKVYENGWHHFVSGNIPAIILIKNGSVIPTVNLAQSTKDIDWNHIRLSVYSTNGNATGFVYKPGDADLNEIKISSADGKPRLINDPYNKKVEWTYQKSF